MFKRSWRSFSQTLGGGVLFFVKMPVHNNLVIEPLLVENDITELPVKREWGLELTGERWGF